MKKRTRTILRIVIPLLIAAAMFVSVFFFLELEIRGVIVWVRRFYDSPWDALDKGGRLSYQLVEYGLNEATPTQTIRIDDSNALCLFLCENVLVIEELYTKDGGCRIVGTQTVSSYESIEEQTELGSLDYIELWLLLPNGRYGQKCSYAIRADAAQTPADTRVFPFDVRGESWSVIVTNPK